MIIARLDAAEDEKMRGELDKELHQKIAKIADNPMIYSVLAAAGQADREYHFRNQRLYHA